LTSQKYSHGHNHFTKNRFFFKELIATPVIIMQPIVFSAFFPSVPSHPEALPSNYRIIQLKNLPSINKKMT
jgi:hypothetical protein